VGRFHSIADVYHLITVWNERQARRLLVPAGSGPWPTSARRSTSTGGAAGRTARGSPVLLADLIDDAGGLVERVTHSRRSGTDGLGLHGPRGCRALNRQGIESLK
jgi:hypothetical protein